MLDLLIRLQEMRSCCERARRNPHLTQGERDAVLSHSNLVRDCLPEEVLVHYDRLRRTDRVLQPCPDVFAMAVLVSAYRSLSPRGRRKLAGHFAESSSKRSKPKRTRSVKRRGPALAGRSAGGKRAPR